MFFFKITPDNLDRHSSKGFFRFFRKFLYLPAIIKGIYQHPLNRKNKIYSVIKFIIFQIEIRLFKKFKIFKWIDNSLLKVYLGDSSLTCNYYTGLFEYEPMSFLLHAHRPTYKFIDVGANIGSYSILASGVIGSKTIAFEPNKKSYLKIIDQAKINNISNLITVKNIGIGDKKVKHFFTSNRNELNRVAIKGLDKKENVEEVNFSTLDDEIKTNDDFIMKIDVEGFEMNVLKGAKNTMKLDNFIALIIEINGFNRFYGVDESNIHNLILSYGFKLYDYEPFSKKLTEQNTIQNEKNSNKSDFIYIKNINKIKKNILNYKYKKFHTNKGLFF